MSIDNALDDARDAATGFLNAEGRHPGHVLIGLGLTVGFALAATVFATRTLAPTYDRPGDGHAPVTERPRGPLSLILPAVFSVTTLSAGRSRPAPPTGW
ncbi:MAG: TspO protein, partial [Brevundimonas sp.]|nr:TspO protein [Brevundimonas sp.]